MSAKLSCYKPHKGEDHYWSLPISELGGGRACRKCGHIQSGRADRLAIKRAKARKEIAE